MLIKLSRIDAACHGASQPLILALMTTHLTSFVAHVMCDFV